MTSITISTSSKSHSGNVEEVHVAPNLISLRLRLHCLWKPLCVKPSLMHVVTLFCSYDEITQIPKPFLYHRFDVQSSKDVWSETERYTMGGKKGRWWILSLGSISRSQRKTHNDNYHFQAHITGHALRIYCLIISTNFSYQLIKEALHWNIKGNQ